MNQSFSKTALGIIGLLPISGLSGCVVRDHRPREVIVEERPRREVIIDEPRYREREVIIEERPPEVRYEVRGDAPSREHVWIEGHHVRVGNHWDWDHGHWERRPRHEAIWIPGRYEQRGHGYVWIEGRWR